MKAMSVTEVKQRSLRGLSLLVMREGAIKMIAIAGQLLLVRLLVPQYFGIIAVVSFFMDMSDLFSDIGLVSGVIQRKGTISHDVLSSLFWVKMMIQVALALVLLAAYSCLDRFFPTLSAVDVRIFYIFLFTLFFRPLRGLLYGLLERDLRYDAIPVVDITGLLVYFGIAIACAYSGLGIWSLVWSVLAKDVVEMLLLEFFHPFFPALRFFWSEVRPFLRFGIAVQGNTILGVLQQSTIPLLGGMLASPTAIGLLDWSSNIASLPRSISDNVGRISFSSFSRIQENTALLEKAIQESLTLLLLIVAFFVDAAIFLGGEAIFYILGPAWAGASVILPWVLLSEFFLAIVAVLQQVLVVRGKASSLVVRSVLSIFLQWIVAFFLFHIFGYAGIVIGICTGMALQSLFCLMLVRRVGISIHIRAIFAPVLWVSTMTAGIGWMLGLLPHSFLWFFFRGGIFGVAFILLTYIFAKPTVLRVFSLFREYVFMIGSTKS